ncbi:MAG: hypothetical protein ABL907_22935, partial [Hyphomicrobium sp.]
MSRLLLGSTDKWIELADGTRVTPSHRYLRPDGSFEEIATILAMDGMVVAADGTPTQVTGRLIRATDAGSDATWIEQDPINVGGVLVRPAPIFGWRTYNFTVEGLHTYIAGGLRVHNDCVQTGDTFDDVDYDPVTGEVNWNGTDANGAALSITEVYNPATGLPQIVQRDVTFDSNDAVVTTTWNAFDANQNPVGEPDREVTFPNQTFTGAAVGSIFGASLGQALAGDNVFAQIAAGSALSAVLKDVGHSLHIYFNDTQALSGSPTAMTFEQSIDAGFNNFSADLANAFQTQSIGALSGFLTGELADALHLGNGVGSGLLRSAAGSVTNTVLTNVVNGAVGADIFSGLSGSVTTGIGSYLGSYLAHQIVTPNTQAAAISGSIGGALGSLASVAIIGSFGFSTLLNIGLSILIPGIGALIGTVLGTVLGNLFGGGDEGYGVSEVTLVAATGLFANTANYSD